MDRIRDQEGMDFLTEGLRRPYDYDAILLIRII